MYTEKDFGLTKLPGLSEKQIGEHLKLYSGYVKNVNSLLSEMEDLKKDPEKNRIALSELTRRFSFEWDGMRMHEYYFEALGGENTPGASVVTALEKNYGDIEAWEKDFKRVGMLRGAGWAVLAHDAASDKFFNVWVNDHELGHLAGCNILIAMDVWEHAYLLDYLPSGRKDYIDVFFKNLSWDVVEKRLKNSSQ